MDPGTIPASLLRQALLAAGDRIAREKDVLSALDASAGDGDLGATLGAGFAHVAAALTARSVDSDIGTLLRDVGSTLARKAPSTFGALVGGAFLRCSAAFDGVTELTGRDVARLMAMLTAAVSERGQAAPGQRTVVDALQGSAQAADAAATADLNAPEVMNAAARGASEGAERTAKMEAKFGRAAWVADRARGHRDAGAVAWAMYLEALAASIADASHLTVKKCGLRSTNELGS